MGGFILAKQNSSKFNLSNALKIFNEKELIISKEISFLNYILYTYNKKSFTNQNFFYFGNDFIVSTGTPIYKRLTGENAVRELYNDFKNKKEVTFNDFNGHYCYIIFINHDLYLFNDFNGVYHVYYDDNKEIFSTSFLAIANSLYKKEISKQGLYEYLFYGATYGAETIVNEIIRLDSKNIIQLAPKLKYKRKSFRTYKKINLNFNEYIDSIVANLDNYFKTLANNFTGFSLGLSGGFDSRLILSLLLNNNIKPLIYTAGDPKTSDVKIASQISLDFELDYINYCENDKSYFEKPYEQIIKERFIIDDGYTIGGIFSPILDMDFEISQKSRINLNGGGGEIYREFWKLPEKKIKVKKFLNVKYKDFSIEIFESKLNIDNFLNQFGQKIIDNLDIETTNSNLNSLSTRLIYPNFRLKYWTALACKKINQFSYALLPFAEPILYFESINIPLKYKIAGKFEAGLIKKINPDLAKYQSDYGFNFYDGPSLKAITTDWIKIYTPLSSRPFIRRSRKKNIAEIENLKKREKLIFNKEKVVSEYINLDKIIDWEMYSRALTIEYFYRNFM